MRLGNGLWEHTNFNSRLQPIQIGLGATSTTSGVLQLDYSYGATASSNNGNITSQTITAPTTSGPNLVLTQTYTYDQVNRLKTASEGANWTQTYDYDVYGNRAVRVGSYIPTPALTPTSAHSTDLSAFNSTNNRIALSGYGYDPAGNLISDPTTAANGMVYDAENRMTSYTKSGVTTTYAYDGDGRRVSKTDSSGTLVFVYNAAGQLIADYTTQSVTGTLTTSYLTTDHLGSTRVVTNDTGGVKARKDYLPFGEEIGSNIGGRSGVAGYTALDSTRQKFTGKEMDAESGLHYFLARYLSGEQGRFLSVDMANPAIANPQTLNRYQHALNNPLRFIDPDGNQERDTSGVERFLRALLEYFGGGRVKDPDSNPQDRPGADRNYGPVPQSASEMTARYTQTFGDGAQTLYDIVSVFDLSGVGSLSETLYDYQQGKIDETQLVSKMAGFVLGNIHKAGDFASVVLQSAIDQFDTNTPDKVAGFDIYGAKQVEGNTYTRFC